MFVHEIELLCLRPTFSESLTPRWLITSDLELLDPKDHTVPTLAISTAISILAK